MLGILVAVASVAPGFVIAQRRGRIRRIGFLAPTTTYAEKELWDALADLGYRRGDNLDVEYRAAEGNFEALPALAAQLVERKVELIVAMRTQAAIAAKRATSTIPIVMVGVSDPVEAGLVASLARPGGNVTGTSTVVAATVGKQLALLRELLPSVTRVGVVWNPSNPVFQRAQLSAATAAGRDLGMQLERFEVSDLARLDEAFQRMQQRAIEGLLVLSDPLYVSRPRSMFDLALKYRIPTVSGARVLAEAGALATYGPDFSEGHRQAAVYIDRILKGARPEDLPIEQNTAFEVVVNTATSEALGIRLPRPLLLRAETVR